MKEESVLIGEKAADYIKYLERQIEQLKGSEQRYHKMIEEVEDYAILSMDLNGIVQNWNKGAEKIKGYKEEEIIGKNFKIFYLKEDQDKRLPEKLISDASVYGKAIHEGWRVRKNGSTFWGSIVITALHDDNGGIIGFSKVTRNLTERKLAEDKLKQFSAELEAKNKELEQFVYVASHDMKEPLRKVVLYGGLLKESLSGRLSLKEAGYLDKAINGANRMNALIDDLLNYSVVSIQHNLLEAIDLNIVLDNVLAFYQENILEAAIYITTDRLPIINGIKFQLNQLFENLIGNAIKYRQINTPLTIIITYEYVGQPEILGLINLNGFHKISIADNGMGFEEKYAEQIFNIFQRLVSKEEFEGTGIGLAICKKAAQNHNGDIVAHGKLLKGATFDLYLPVN